MTSRRLWIPFVLGYLRLMMLLPADGAFPDVVFSHKNSIRAISDPSKEIRTILSGLDNIWDVACDAEEEMIFWTNLRSANTPSIFRTSFFHPTIVTECHTTGPGIPENLAYDSIAQNIYFTETEGKVVYISVCDPFGKACAKLVNTGNALIPDLAIHPASGQMFWIRWIPQAIMRAGMDGSDPKVIIRTIDFPTSMAVDEQAERLYWESLTVCTIESSKFDGTDRRRHAQFKSYSDQCVSGLTIWGGIIYWKNDLHIWRCELASEVCQKVVEFPFSVTTRVKDMASCNSLAGDTQSISNCASLGCSQLCVQAPSANGSTSRCLCPNNGLSLQNDCPEVAPDHVCDANEFQCTSGKNTCIASHLLCDGERHCPDGSDERNCPTTTTESYEQKHIQTTNSNESGWWKWMAHPFVFAIVLILTLLLFFGGLGAGIYYQKRRQKQNNAGRILYDRAKGRALVSLLPPAS